MPQLLRRRPSPAMVVALLALFVALGGSSYAALRIGSAQIVNNSVRSKDIRNNDVRSQDIRNNDVLSKDIRNSTIRGGDVARDTLTGSDINESTLGRVPVAGSALVASSTRSVRTASVRSVAEGAPAVTLASYGPFTVTGSCVRNGTSTVASISMTTTEANSSLAANDSRTGQFGPADGPQPIQSVTDTAGGTPTPGLGYDDTFVAFAPSGRAISGLMSPWADASAGASGVCKFFGGFIVAG
jgi:hypothetical protein